MKEVHVLVGAFFDDARIIPVLMEVKEYKAGAYEDHKLYLTITLNEKEAGISSRTWNAASERSGSHDTPASDINLTELLRTVKDDSGSLLKYVPDPLLDTQQRKYKAEAVKKEREKIGDLQYESASCRFLIFSMPLPAEPARIRTSPGSGPGPCPRLRAPGSGG